MATPPAKRKALDMHVGRPVPVAVDDEILMKLRHENKQLKSFVKRFFNEGIIDSEVLPLEFQKEIEHVERKFVIEHVIRNGDADWMTLSQKWKYDVEVVCAMYELGRCQNIPKWIELPYHLLTNERVLMSSFKSWKGPSWKEAPWWMQDNPDIIIAAYKSKCRKLSGSDLPEHLKRDHCELAVDFIKKREITVDECTCFNDEILHQLVEEGELDWSMLPHHLKTNLEFAMSLSKFPTIELQEQILLLFPDVGGDLAFWRKFFVLSKYVGIELWVKDFVPPSLLSDRAFMLDLCGENEFVVRLVPAPLLAEREFLEPLLARNIETLCFIPRETQLLFPDLIRNALPSILRHGLEAMVDFSLFRDREFALSWFMAGLYNKYSRDHGEGIVSWYNGDQEVALAYLKHCSSDRSSDVSPTLLEDRDFVLKAVRVHPWLFHNINPQLRSDHFVFTKFAAHSYEFTKEVLLEMHLRGKGAEIQGYLEFIRSELNKYDGLELFCGEAIKRSDLNISKLNQGSDTFRYFKELLAELIEVPSGEWLQDLRRAEDHASKVIQTWTPEA